MKTSSTNITVDPIQTIPALHDQAANKIIRNYTLAATASGLIPFSLLAAASLSSTQVLMVRKLCHLFQVPFAPKRAQIILNSVLGSAATSLIAVATASVPGINSPMKGLTNAALSSLYTATVGEFYKVHFQSGGNLENASISDLSKYFIEEYKRGDISLGKMTNPVHTIKDMMS